MTRRLVAGAMALVALAALAFTYRALLRPVEDSPARVDGLLLLVGGDGERLQLATELISEGVADQLVVAAADLDASNTSRRLCEGEFDEAFSQVVVYCLPGENDTRAEARQLAAFASEQGWQHVLVVTSSTHLTRAKQFIGRCFDGRVDGVAATPDAGPAVWFGQLLHEWGGLMEGQLRRGC